MATRRDFLITSGAGVGAILLSGCQTTLPQGGPGPVAGPVDGPLIDQVAAICRRLAPLGWRDLLLAVSDNGLDITAADLGAELAKPLKTIKREQPGFGDFNLAGQRGITPGQPDLSLLYHALAAPTVATKADGKTPLDGFATLGELTIVENYVYASARTSLTAVAKRARDLGGKDLAIVVYALEYRNAPQSVSGLAAELCFARTGIARIGTTTPLYDGALRGFSALDPQNPFAFRAVPQRFAAYLATKITGNNDTFGPQDPQTGDDKRSFWVPLHKLFSGAECLTDRKLTVAYESRLQNEKLRQFQLYAQLYGLDNQWSPEQLEQAPFVLRDDEIGALSSDPAIGPGVLTPRPRPQLATLATLKDGTQVTFDVPPNADYPDPFSLYFSTLQVLPVGDDVRPDYTYGRSPTANRQASEYINVRHRYRDGRIDSLNRRPELMKIINDGNYQTAHYIDYAGNGWVTAHCPELDGLVKSRQPAYAMVAPPDFFPEVSQRELTNWWKTEVPEALQSTLWALPPLPLSQQRMAADVSLSVGFSITDNTITALVAQPGSAKGPPQQANGPHANRSNGLPDSAAGIFDPGWESSQGYVYLDKANDPSSGDPPKIQPYLEDTGLGTPFIEDIKLCAALGNYWPGVSPDNTRSFAPNKQAVEGAGFPYPWPTSAPLTDQETGIAPLADGRYLPWDGVRGPRLEGHEVVYASIYHVDYLDIQGTMTAALTARIDAAEYIRRVVAMEAVYLALGIKPPTKDKKRKIEDVLLEKSQWAVQSFRTVEAGDSELTAAAAKAGATGWQYRFFLYTPLKQSESTATFETRVTIKDRVTAYTRGSEVLYRRNDGPWTLVKTAI